MGFNLFANAGQSAQTSLIAGGISTAAGAIGDISSGLGQSKQFAYQSVIAQNNATIAGQNASSDLAAGSYEESLRKTQTGETIGAQKAAQASNGLDVNVGSAVAVRQSTALIGSMDAAVAHYNAAKQAFNEQAQATSFTAQAQADKLAAGNATLAGIGKAGATILSGASSVGAKYAGYQLSGALS